MKSNSDIIYVISALVVVVIFLGGLKLFIDQDNKDKVTETIIEPSQQEQVVDFSHNPDLYYQSLLYKSDKGFKEIGLYTILGPDYDKFNYVVDADPEIQEYMDKTLKGYCHQTLNLFNMAWNDMKENDLYDGHMINVLESIIRQQKMFLNKYGSANVKEYAKTNIFRDENINLAAAYETAAKMKKVEMLDHFTTEYELKNTK